MTITRRDLLRTAAGVTACGTFGLIPTSTARGAEMNQNDGVTFKIHPIGRVEKTNNATRLRIHDKYKPALKGLDGFSHAVVMYWFDKNDTPQKRGILQVHPRGNKSNPLTGVFACRAPVRPNLISFNVCKVISIEDGVVDIENIDAFDKTPIVDIKPFIPGSDAPTKGIRVPKWLHGPRSEG